MKRKTAFGKALAAALLLGVGGGVLAVAEAHPGKSGDDKSGSPQQRMMHQMMRQMHGCMQQRMTGMSADAAGKDGHMDRSAMRARMMEMMKGCMAEMKNRPHADGAMDGHGGAGHKGGHDRNGAGHGADGHKH